VAGILMGNGVFKHAGTVLLTGERTLIEGRNPG
jgi:hypothetical protein